MLGAVEWDDSREVGWQHSAPFIDGLVVAAGALVKWVRGMILGQSLERVDTFCAWYERVKAAVEIVH